MTAALAVSAAPGVLVVGPAWIGDMVMAQALIALLRRQVPQRPVTMLAPAATLPLAARMPGVERAVLLDAGHGELALRRRWQLARTLAAAEFAQAIVLPNSFKSALVPLMAGIPRRTGWHGESRLGVLNDRRRLQAADYPLQLDRFLALGLGPGEPLPDPRPRPVLRTDPDNQRRLVSRFALDTGGAVVLLPGAAFGPAKRWPVGHFAELARRLRASGRPLWVLGGPGERALGRTIVEAAGPGVIDLTGRTDLVDAVDLLALAGHVVCNDSGLMHVAAAVGAPLTALYGASSPQFTPPLSSGARVLSLELPCSPCFARACPLGHHRCLEDLRPEQVLAGL